MKRILLLLMIVPIIGFVQVVITESQNKYYYENGQLEAEGSFKNKMDFGNIIMKTEM